MGWKKSALVRGLVIWVTGLFLIYISVVMLIMLGQFAAKLNGVVLEVEPSAWMGLFGSAIGSGITVWGALVISRQDRILKEAANRKALLLFMNEELMSNYQAFKKNFHSSNLNNFEVFSGQCRYKFRYQDWNALTVNLPGLSQGNEALVLDFMRLYSELKTIEGLYTEKEIDGLDHRLKMTRDTFERLILAMKREGYTEESLK